MTNVPLTFNDDDLVGLHLPHDDAIIFIARTNNHNVHRILIENCSLVNGYVIWKRIISVRN